MCILMFIFRYSEREDKSFRNERQQVFPQFSLLLIYFFMKF